MQGIELFRQRFPQYADIDDDTVAQRVYEKDYAKSALDYTAFRSKFLKTVPLEQPVPEVGTIEPNTGTVAPTGDIQQISPPEHTGALPIQDMVADQKDQVSSSVPGAIGGLIKRSAARVMKGVAELPELALRKAQDVAGDAVGATPEEMEAVRGLGPVGQAADIAGKAKDWAKGKEDEAVAALPPPVQRAIQLQLVQRDEQHKLQIGEGAKNPWWWTANLIDVGAMMAPGIGATALAARTAYSGRFAQVMTEMSGQKIAHSLAIKEAEKQAMKAATRAAVIVGGTTEGGIAGGMNASQTEEALGQLTEETMMGYKPYQELRDRGFNHEAAKSRVARDKALEVGLATGIVTGASGAPLNSLMGRWFAGGKIASSRIGAVGKIAAAEGTQEFFQEGSDQLIQNISEMPITGKKPWEGVLESAITGGVLGAVVGGAAGAVAGPEGPGADKSSAPEAQEKMARLNTAAENLRERIKAASNPATQIKAADVVEAREEYQTALAELGDLALRSGKLKPKQQQEVAAALQEAQAAGQREESLPLEGEVRPAEEAPAPAKPGPDGKPKVTAVPTLSEAETARHDVLNRVATADTIEGSDIESLIGEGMARMTPAGRPILLPAGKRQLKELTGRLDAAEKVEKAAIEAAKPELKPVAEKQQAVVKKPQMAEKKEAAPAAKPLPATKKPATPSVAPIKKAITAEATLAMSGAKMEALVAPVRERLKAERVKQRRAGLKVIEGGKKDEELPKGAASMVEDKPATPDFSDRSKSARAPHYASDTPEDAKNVVRFAFDRTSRYRGKYPVRAGELLDALEKLHSEDPLHPGLNQFTGIKWGRSGQAMRRRVTEALKSFDQSDKITPEQLFEAMYEEPAPKGAASMAEKHPTFVADDETVEQVPIEMLAHETFEDHPDSLTRLRASIKSQGIKEPLELWQHEGELSVQDGKHRLEAARQLGLTHVPARIADSNKIGRTPKGAASMPEADKLAKDILDRPGVRDEQKRISEENRQTLLARETADKSALEVGAELTVPAEAILTRKDFFARAAAENKSGRGSKTEGPLEVWQREDGRLLITDGQHRFAAGVAEGRDQFKVKVVGRGPVAGILKDKADIPKNAAYVFKQPPAKVSALVGGEEMPNETVSPADLEKVTTFIERELGVRINVAQKFSETPPHVQRALAVIANASRVQGYYFDGPHGPEVWLIRENLRNATAAAEVTYHESTHMGVRGLVGRPGTTGYNRTMDQLWASFPAQGREAAQRNQIDLTTGSDKFRLAKRRLAAEEMLAYAGGRLMLKGKKANHSVWQRIVDAFRELMRQLNVKRYQKYNDKDLESLIFSAIRKASEVSAKQRKYEMEVAEAVVADAAEPLQSATFEDFRPENIGNILERDDWAILTADDPSGKTLTPQQNMQRWHRLRQELGIRKLPFLNAEGRYKEVGGRPENGFVVIGITEQNAAHLGKTFGQESVLTRKGLVYMDGRPVTPATGITVHKTAPENFYTRIPKTGAIFTADIDFGGAASVAKDEAAATVQHIAEHLSPEVRTQLNRGTAKKLVSMFGSLPDQEEMGAVAEAAIAKKGWYRDAAETLVNVFGPDSPRFAGLLAALSPRVWVEDNFKHAVNVWSAWVKAGRPTGRAEIIKIMSKNLWNATDRNGETVGVMNSWRNNTVSALTNTDPANLVLSGPKVDSFAANLRGEVNKVTLDSWMATYALIDQAGLGGSRNKAGTNPGKRPVYAAFEARVRQTAQYLTKKTGEVWTPAEVQETIWSWTKTLKTMAAKGGSMTSAKQIVENGELTDELINATVDFTTLFAQPQHQQTLRDVGYGDALDRANGAQAARARTGRKAPPPSPEDRERLLTAAGRIDRGLSRADEGESLDDIAFSMAEDQTDAPAFKRWFGNSKVVDENSDPLLVYHGRGNDFEAFEAAGGVFVTPDAEYAADFATSVGRETPNIVPLFAKMERPLDLRGLGTDHVNFARLLETMQELGLDAGSAQKLDSALPGSRPATDLRPVWSWVRNFYEPVRKILRSNGFDGIIQHEEHNDKTADTYWLIDSNQLKSAIGNRGTFDPDDSRIAFSLLGGNTGNPDLDSFLDKIGAPKRSLKQWWQDTTDNLRARIRFNVVDDLWGIGNAGNLAGLSLADVGYKNAHLARSAAELTQALIEHGFPVWHRDGTHEVAGVDTGMGGLIDIFKPLKSKVNLWLAWKTANRADRLMGEGRENKFTQAEIDAAKNLHLQHPEFLVVDKQFVAFQKKVLDFAEAAGIIDPAGRALWEHADYIPFYRIIESGQIKGPSAQSPLGKVRNQIRRLRGGKENLGDPLENIAKNWHSLMDASLKAHAARTVVDALDGTGLVTRAPQIEMTQAIVPLSQMKEFIKNNPILAAHLKAAGLDPAKLPPAAFQGLQKMLAVQPPSGEDIISVWRNGKREYWHVHDELLFESLMNIPKAAWGPWMEFFRFPKRIYTATTTSTPQFGIRNFWRDMLHAFVQGAAGRSTTIIPGWDSVKGAFAQLTMNPDAVANLAGGGSFTHGYIRGGDMTGAANTIRRSLHKASPSQHILDTPMKVVRFYRDLLNAAENTHRIAIRQRMLKAGASRLDATYESRDLLDFAKTGNSNTVRFIVQSVPFWNARLQGLDRLGRGASGKKAVAAAIFGRGMLYTMAVIALLAKYYDDDRYKALGDADKANHLHFWDVFEDGDHWKLPVPFEVGTLFGTVPMAVFDYFVTNAEEPDRAKLSLKLLAHAFENTLNMRPDIRVIQPVLELAINKNLFTEAPILTMGDEAVLPEDQDDPRISPSYRLLSRLMPEAAPEALRSPKQLQHLGRGYVGNVQDFLLLVTDMAARRIMGEPEGAERPGPFSSSFRQVGPARSTRYTNTMYDVADEADRIASSVNRLEKAGTDEADERIEELETENESLLDVRDDFVDAAKDVGELRKEMRAIQLDPDLTPKEKREQMDELQQELNDIAEETWDLRPGGKLNSETAGELIGRSVPEQQQILRNAGLPATAAALE